MIHKTKSPRSNHVRIVFELPASVWADRITVVGDFNHWNPNATPMQQDREGVWRAILDLPCGSHCEFRYLIDDHWKTDYQADNFVANVYGTENSVVHAILPAEWLRVEKTWNQQWNNGELTSYPLLPCSTQ